MGWSFPLFAFCSVALPLFDFKLLRGTLSLCIVCLLSPVGKMAMQLVAAQMMSMVWNGPTGPQLMKTSAVRS